MGTILNQSLADELVKMSEVDQAMRIKAIEDDTVFDSSVDEVNSKRLQEIVETSGWPTIPQVGIEGSNAAWLVLQHAPSLDFMKHCLGLMKAFPKGIANQANIAYLEDRVLMIDGKPQIYGTQFKGRGKDLKVWSIQDPEHIDELRASVGLGTFAENEARILELYGK
ncbi:MAG TPA: DUF6624 domain-containing protein [Candidatus Saccharimonadia bacterium]|nr:DUF6624 domain-containing protein [Candidatus Saccharimonadia bacterium]